MWIERLRSGDRSGIFERHNVVTDSVSDKSEPVNERTHTDQQK